MNFAENFTDISQRVELIRKEQETQRLFSIGQLVITTIVAWLLVIFLCVYALKRHKISALDPKKRDLSSVESGEAEPMVRLNMKSQSVQTVGENEPRQNLFRKPISEEATLPQSPPVVGTVVVEEEVNAVVSMHADAADSSSDPQHDENTSSGSGSFSPPSTGNRMRPRLNGVSSSRTVSRSGSSSSSSDQILTQSETSAVNENV